MSDRPYDEPAFPIRGGLNEHQFSGLTMRDYFAAKAMQSLLGHLQHGIRPNDCTVMAEDAYLLADAMLKARTQP